MFKQLIVDTAFDSMAALSAGIDWIFVPVSLRNADLAACCAFALALSLVVMSWEVLAGRRTIWECCRLLLAAWLAGVLLVTMAAHAVITLWLAATGILFWAGRRKPGPKGWLAAVLLATLPSVPFFILHANPTLVWHVIALKPDRLVAEGGHAFRARIKDGLPADAASEFWRVVPARSERRLAVACATDRSSRPVISIQQVKDEGGGRFRLKDDNVWFSSSDGSNPKQGGLRYFLVHPLPWAVKAHGILEAIHKIARALTGLGWLAGALWLMVRQFKPAALAGWRWLLTQRAFLVIGTLFFIGYGAHQWRFLHQDARMQMVTSRDDDGYMLERLERSYHLKSMDPYKVQNNAYGAASYYPFAFVSFAAGQLGLPLSLEVINLWARGLKTLMSLAMLWAVWLLAAQHFGRGIAIAATLFMATNQGFLAYSSSPFYPDAWMAAFTILSLAFMLDLLERWSDRSFYLAAMCAGFSVAIKFFTFLLLPFLAVVCIISARRLHRERPGGPGSFLIRRAIAALAVLAGVYYLCNPFLEYNVKWLAPGWKDFYTYYDTETSDVVVTGSGPGIVGWLERAYLTGADRSEFAVLVLGLLAVPAVMIAAWKLRSAPLESKLAAGHRTDVGKVIFLLAFCFVFQAYLLVTLTMPRFVDGRLLLHFFPPLLAVCGWLLCRFVPLLRDLREPAGQAATSSRNLSKPVLAAAALCAVLAAVWLLPPRLVNLWEFARYYGQAISKSALTAWFDRIGLPKNAMILNAMQSYIPRSYTRLIDGQWRPPEVENIMFQNRDLPAVFVEAEPYYSIFFSPQVKQAGVNTAAQLAKFEEGSAFYLKLRSNRLFPYLLADTGTEVTQTNFLPKQWVIENYRAYANPFAFADNAIDRARLEIVEPWHPPSDATFPHWLAKGHLTSCRKLVFHWDEPASLSLIHLITELPDTPEFQVEIEETSGLKSTVPLAARSELRSSSTERMAVLSPPKDARSITISRVDGAVFPGNLVRGLRAHPPVPLALNPASHFLDIQPPAGGDAAGWTDVIASRPLPGRGARIDAGGKTTFSLVPKKRITLQSLLLVFDPVARGYVECVCKFEDGAEERLEAPALMHSRNPDVSYVRLESAVTKPLKSLDCSIVLEGTGQTPGQILLRQAAATVMLVEP